jgi:phosphoglycolate phosphatase
MIATMVGPTPLHRPRLVLFDLDGTLADTAPDLVAPINAMRLARGMEAMPFGRLRPHASAGARGLIGAGLGIAKDDPEFEALKADFLARYEAAMVVQTRLFAGMDELLDQLEDAGIAWGIVSNKVERYVRWIVEALGLHQRAAAVVGGDTAPRPKPFPDPLLLALEQTRTTAAEAVYVGDDIRDLQAARAAGMPMIAAAYGYVGLESPPELWGADAVVARPGEIAGLIGICADRAQSAELTGRERRPR